MFVAIGTYWKLGDDPEPYRSRLKVFMDNRIAISPLYRGYYSTAAEVIADLIAAQGNEKAFETLFKIKVPDGVPSTAIDVAKRFVVNEFITMRLAFGGFKSFGARNFNGYFGGTNDPSDRPYRGIDEGA
ncbi:hypothetical protein KRR38_01355 [Novosphingobium sp. G106]|uniref:hypothetical protein n=1 Tax=Novosphingobium sp. G106 TaxID=2849500 RepID=UPI001C2D780D|nr:hypothetical protein [Novosphingobium sp. G106]MBV1686351.1 hypothetical protein [Novosphingobium sp. G106]